MPDGSGLAFVQGLVTVGSVNSLYVVHRPVSFAQLKLQVIQLLLKQVTIFFLAGNDISLPFRVCVGEIL